MTGIMSASSISDFFRKPTVHVLLIILTGLLAYSNSYNVPFIFDDMPGIVENPIIKNFRYFFDPSSAHEFDLYNGFKNRYVGYLTFALNFRLHGLGVTGYHIFNLAVHIGNALLVYWLVRLAFRSPCFKDIEDPGAVDLPAGFIALFSALLFVAHPIQTQAVTYIVQRFTSLATLFYLFSLIMYIKARLAWSPEGKQFPISSISFYVISLVSAVLAMKTKEIAFTLPVMIILYELFFLDGKLGRRILYLFPLLLTLLIIPLSLINIDRPLGDLIGDVSEATRVQTPLSRWDYLFTQFRVITTYIRLLLFPVNQNLDYDYPIYHSFLNPEVFLAFLLLSVIFVSGVFLFYRSRLENRESHFNSRSLLRFAAFGIFWFFITLSVESSLIPIEDVIFEHRLYLPSVGMFLAVLGSLSGLTAGAGKRQQFVYAVLTGLVVLLSAATFIRNQVWQSEVSIWRDTAQKSPRKLRALGNLGAAYQKENRFDEAIAVIMSAQQLPTTKTYDVAETYSVLGLAYLGKEEYVQAHDCFLKVLLINPRHPNIYNNLAAYYGKTGNYPTSMEMSRKSLKYNPQDYVAYNNLGLAYASLGNYSAAISMYKKSIEINRYYPEAHLNIGLAYLAVREVMHAIAHYQILTRLDDNFAASLLHEINIYRGRFQ